MLRRSVLVLLAVTIAAAFGNVAGFAQPSALHAAAVKASTPPLTSKETRVHFTSRTILVPRAVVQKNLIGISNTGVFKFKTAAGSLAQVKAGKVMLLQGSDALFVTKVTRSKLQLLVSTKAATLTQVISSGHISFTGAPNFRQATLAKIVVPPTPKKAKKGAVHFARPGYPYVGSAPGSSGARAATSPSFSAQGAVGKFGYSLTFTPASSTRLNISGTICFLSFSVCGNGPATGLSAEINLSGYIDAGDASGGINVNGGSITNSDISFKSLAAHAHFTYTISRGDGSGGGVADPPVFRIPVGIDFTIPGEIPIYLKLQTAVLFKLGISSKNAVLHGGITLNSTSTDSLDQHGTSVAGADTGEQLHGKVLDQSDGGVPASISLAPSGAIVSVQFPKLGVGLGYTSVNGLAFVDMITTVGQTTGAAVAGMYCSSYDIDISIHSGLEAQIGLGKFGLAIASPVKLLYDKPFKTHDPGCPQT